MARRSATVSLLAGLLAAAMLPLGVSAADPLPSSMAAVGDSISQAASSGGSLGKDYPANAWSTGTNTTVSSHYLRLLALNPAISGRAWNDSVSGAKVADLAAQMQVVAGQHPDYLTVLIGGNDLCTSTVGAMTSVADFTARFSSAMATLKTGSPDTKVLVVSIPRVYQLWELFHGTFWARTIWAAGAVCQSLLANPTSTQSADVARRAQVAQRNVDYNVALEQVCSQYGSGCRFDGGAVYDVVFAKSDVAADYFHPSIAGQAKLAAVSWAAGYWPDGAPTPDTPPTAAFTSSCTGLGCTFDASGSTDDHGIVAYGWTFGDGGTGSGVTASHTFAAAGTYAVNLVVTDTAGQTGTAAKSVAVSAPTGTVHLASAEGSAVARKSGWTATITVSVADAAGGPVGAATVTGTWSMGGVGSCVTAAEGTCSFSANTNRKSTSVTWTVTGIAAAGYAYDPAANVKSQVTISTP